MFIFCNLVAVTVLCNADCNGNGNCNIVDNIGSCVCYAGNLKMNSLAEIIYQKSENILLVAFSFRVNLVIDLGRPRIFGETFGQFFYDN